MKAQQRLQLQQLATKTETETERNRRAEGRTGLQTFGYNLTEISVLSFKLFST